MIRLKNVSKFYYNKGVIASGFTRVNLEFNIGEFVAITGESGSGKSTLLNLIRGLDSYEEGEMYINGEETSHYSEQDFEDDRRKYIGNIFQNFNLVNSYTVYQTVELVLLLNGCKNKNIKKDVLELIKKVGLYKFRNTKVSKLSGGQKQRVAIARALAKNTPIIIADEPTGNLDSKSAKEIIKLLSKISKDKLVIIVTHNYEQVEDYITRKIKMHDGKVLEDKVIKETNVSNEAKDETVKYKIITFLNKIRLGLRNTFNIIPKFLLLFAVYLFVVVALMSEYASFKQQEYQASVEGYNYIFSNSNSNTVKRIVINKKDRTSFNDEELNNIKKINNVDRVVKVDLLLDTYISLSNDSDLYLSGTAYSIDDLDKKVDVGRLPENDNEVVIYGGRGDYYLSNMKDDLMKSELYLTDSYDMTDKSVKLKIVGICYSEEDYTDETIFYLSNSILKKLEFRVNQQYSDSKVLFLNSYYNVAPYSMSFNFFPSYNVPRGQVFISEDLKWSCEKENCYGKPLKIEISNLYYNEELNLSVTKLYNKKNMASILEYSDYDNYNGAIFINVDEYNALFDKGSYQSSVFVEDDRKISDVAKELNDLGYNTLVIKDTLKSYGTTQIIKIFKAVVTLVLVATLFFISYFIIKLILKSRNVYFSTIRMLGATRKVSKQLLIIELLTVANLAYIIFAICIYLNYCGVFSWNFVNNMLKFLTLGDYIILYIIVLGMSYLISLKYARKLFKNSVMKTLTEEV